MWRTGGKPLSPEHRAKLSAVMKGRRLSPETRAKISESLKGKMAGRAGSAFKHGHKSGGRLSPTYMSWKGMVRRCKDERASNFKDYGGRGIRVCERWLTFENFLRDMGERPPGTSIDRADNELGYFKENCR